MSHLNNADRDERIEEQAVSRRTMLRRLLAGMSGIVLLQPWRHVARAAQERRLRFFHTHTGEWLSIVYFAEGEYRAGALEEVDRFLRDFRTGDVHRIDPKLLDVLHAIQEATESQGTFEVISAYRSPTTNDMLRRRSGGVAKKSLHMQGAAIDVRLTDVETSLLRDAALKLKRGGVGYYPQSDFVHVDTGRVRRW
ncbi:MAG: DUF882 domain-containing protein [Candidatus Latescibacterota bacterium]|nr:MAG: DUF882 domain-containing protein [Candidatus Latescibacterota bacterium]